MARILPCLNTDNLDVTKTVVIVYAIEHYILVGLYAFLFGLLLVNIW